MIPLLPEFRLVWGWLVVVVGLPCLLALLCKPNKTRDAIIAEIFATIVVRAPLMLTLI